MLYTAHLDNKYYLLYLLIAMYVRMDFNVNLLLCNKSVSDPIHWNQSTQVVSSVELKDGGVNYNHKGDT